jgi:hypothetical protein
LIEVVELDDLLPAPRVKHDRCCLCVLCLKQPNAIGERIKVRDRSAVGSHGYFLDSCDVLESGDLRRHTVALKRAEVKLQA